MWTVIFGPRSRGGFCVKAVWQTSVISINPHVVPFSVPFVVPSIVALQTRVCRSCRLLRWRWFNQFVCKHEDESRGTRPSPLSPWKHGRCETLNHSSNRISILLPWANTHHFFPFRPSALKCLLYDERRCWSMPLTGAEISMSELLDVWPVPLLLRVTASRLVDVRSSINLLVGCWQFSGDVSAPSFGSGTSLWVVFFKCDLKICVDYIVP